jgi:hypothetical protein
MKLRDLGLNYEEAAHGIQTAVLHDMKIREAELGSRLAGGSQNGTAINPQSLRVHDSHPNGPKHLRTGLNLSKSDMLGLAILLIDKGIITEEEYLEAMRLGANEELARYQSLYPKVTFR